MDSKQLKSVILKSKSKGIQYMVTHFEMIHQLINEGETANAIYNALLASDNPPPISKSQFYRHLSKYKETSSDGNKSVNDDITPLSKSQVNHEVLDKLKSVDESIHDSGFDADKLI
ncbi:hypothetical protein EOL70_26360 [Leucothrix sargassi]|nr:hypothetical protein EOL70_26360 [Leucothrix sargassi]